MFKTKEAAKRWLEEVAKVPETYDIVRVLLREEDFK